MRSIRLLPIVILTATMLLGMKGISILSGHHGALSGVEVARAQVDEPDVAADSESDMTEDALEREAAEPMPDMPLNSDQATARQDGAEELVEELPGTFQADATRSSDAPNDQNRVDLSTQTSRETLFERLGERRALMDAREQDLRVREQLLEAAERRLGERLEELAALEERVTAVAQAEEDRQTEEIARLVQVYSAMRAKDAAAIFDLLDLPILMEVANAMNPRKMADILGEMNPESARQLTIALAGSPTSSLDDAVDADSDLPRIEGVPIQ